MSSEARAAFDAAADGDASLEEEALFMEDVGQILEEEAQALRFANEAAPVQDEDARLAASVAAVQRFDAEPTPEQAFDVLRLLHARDGRALALEVRPSASPILDVGDHAYVVMKTGKRRHGGPPGFAVTFQSVHNSEHWFPEGSDVGVACRPMARSARRAKPGESSEAHGYRGRFYTLVAKVVDGPKKVRVVDDALGLVRVWRDGSAISSCASTVSSSDGAPSPPNGAKRAKEAAFPPAPGDDDTIFLGSMRVSGDVTVAGNIYGRVVTPPEAADYAEWFPWRLEDLKSGKRLGPGTVVQLANGNELSLDTSGAGACMVVSTTPSIAAGVPGDAKRRGEGALVAFVGQVPVRCRGPVRLGDHLVPSRRHDGVAVAHDRRRDRAPATESLGVAMHAGDGEGEHVVLAFVRWHTAVNRELGERLVTVARRLHGFAVVAVLVVSFAVSSVALALHATLLIDGGRSDRSEHELASVLGFFTVLSLCLCVALAATFQEALPGRYPLLVVALAALPLFVYDVVRGRGAASGSGSVVAWRALSAAFHGAVLFSVSAAARTRARPPDPDALQRVFDASAGPPKRRRSMRLYAAWLALAALAGAAAWVLFAPSVFAVVVVNRDTRKRTRENHADIDYIKGGAEDLEERYDKFEKDFEDYRDYDAASKDDAADAEDAAKDDAADAEDAAKDDAEDAAKDDAADAKKGRRRLRGA